MGLGLPCLATGAIEVETARPPGADYSSYGSFGVRAKEGVPAGHPLGEQGDLFKAARDAAVKTLLAQGLTLVEDGEPDIWVTFYGLEEEELSVEGTSKKIGKVTWVGDPGAHSTRTVDSETLIVEVYDGASGERIWSGWATGGSSNPDKLIGLAAKMVRKVLLELPIR
jgi:hypothetical protein